MTKSIYPFFIFLSFCLILVSACKKDEVASKDVPYGKLEIVHGENQTGTFGTQLSDSIVVKIDSDNSNRQYYVRSEVSQGNGSAFDGFSHWSITEHEADSAGLVTLFWKLGCDQAEQAISLYLYADSITYPIGYVEYHKQASDTIIINANAKAQNGWGPTCGCDEINTGALIRSFNDSVFYIIKEGVYRSLDAGLNWEKIENIPEEYAIIDGQLNSQGWLYLLIRDWGVYYTKDFQSWEEINNGISRPDNGSAFMVEDSCIYAFFDADGMYKTTNNGDHWQQLTSIHSYDNTCYDICRHPDGDIYLHDENDNLIVSRNYGKSWHPITLSQQYAAHGITDIEAKGDRYLYLSTGGASIARLNPPGYSGPQHTYSDNYSQGWISRIKHESGKLYFLVQNTPDPAKDGIYSNENWERIDLGTDAKIHNFFPKSDGTFILITDEGVLYYHE